MTLPHPGLASFVLAVAMACLSSCASSPSADPVPFDTPDTSQFFSGTGGVSVVFELRCGSLDCHGQKSRPMRIYSANGLRLPASEMPAGDGGTASALGPGGGSTTNAEVVANYQSIVALEPEQMAAVSKKGSTTSPTTLLIMKKPLSIEAHKGGKVFTAQSHEAACLTGWLTRKPSPADCTTAVNEFPRDKNP